MTRPTIITLLTLASLTCLMAADDAVLTLKGRGAEGRPPYEGGKLEFLDVSLADQLIHLGSPEQIPLRLSIKYNVLETAPVLLNSRLGTEYWRLYHYAAETMGALYTREDIDLSREGEAIASLEEARAATGYGPPLSKGLVGIRGHYYFLVDQPNGEWLDVVNPPAFFERAELAQRLTFTLANLNDFQLDVSEVQSTWEPGGLIRVKLAVTDADGEQFPVVNAPATIQVGDGRVSLDGETDYLRVPTGWMTASLPQGPVPDEVTAKATVSAMTPDGPREVLVEKTFRRGEGRRTLEQMRAGPEPVELPRNAEGVIRETRALWISGRDITTEKGIEAVVARASDAGLNVLIPSIFVRSTLLARSDLFPLSDSVEEGLDPVAYLIQRAHEKSLEVHPWFCVTYRDRRFRETLPGVDMIDADRNVIPLGADVHRPEYRDFIVNLMVGVARDYDVDGIHLDYIRTMGNCFCDKCRAEFQAEFAKPLAEATEEDWIKWQRGAIGDIVRRTAEGVRAARPDAIMSAAVFANLAGGAAQGQNAAEWARRGWIDVVIPMDYSMQTLAVRANERQFVAALDDDDQLTTGLSLYARSGEETVSRSPDLPREQIDLVRRLGIHGYCLFVYGYLNDEIIEMLKTQINGEPAVPYFR